MAFGGDVSEVPSQPSQFPVGLLLFARLIALLTVLPFVFLLEVFLTGHSLLQARLWSEATDRFGDFWHYRNLLRFIHTPDFFLARDRFAYPAPCAVLYQWIYHLGSHPHVVFNLILWAAQLLSAALLLRALLRSGLGSGQAWRLVLLMAVTSYPWHYLYDRGNIELFVYLLVGGGVWAWFSGRPQLAGALWGCAGALKIYPLLMLAVLAKRGSWRAFAVGAITFLVVLLVSFWYVGPSIKIAATGTVWGIRGFVGTYGAHTRFGELVYDHSLLGGMKELVSLPFLHPAYEQITLSHAYEGLVILLGPVFFVRWRAKAPVVNQLCLLLVGLMSLPPVSYDYTLVYAYIVIGVVMCAYVSAVVRGERFPGATIYFVAFAILCTTESWISIWGVEPNGLFKSSALVTVGVLLVRYPLRLAQTTIRFGSDADATLRRESVQEV